MEHILAGLRAAGEETRLRLLVLCAYGDRTVSDLCRILGQSQPRISRHLKILCDSGLLERFREGSRVFCRLAPDGVGAQLAAQIIGLLPSSDSVLMADRARLDQLRDERRRIAEAYFSANASEWNAIRTLHVDEAEIEGTLLDIALQKPFTDMIDVGTGTGRILGLLGRHARRAVGLDLSREMLALARSALEADEALRHCTVRLGDMYALPFPDHAADLVTVHQVLHYADSPSAVIAESARVLRPGGRLVLVDFAPHNHEELCCDHNHLRLGFADHEIHAWLIAAGLEPVRSVSLPGTKREPGMLTVMIWLAARPGAETCSLSE
ncbi:MULTISPECIES: ArsR/SmtB family transcription factor [unclassified Haematospirillum]|uniref:ArsR/SmtB family transcription factor n=1 Tax=unclassified Haematospirillum TaxID=2622088 RepID=UPI0014390899|nr:MULTISPECIES: metalloregulator ArsR/SmtB family transcription factor [unclassified Haematospirillum]NKD55027.1 metalloregulator ArsR/SmtB family transcription factor [Haematospirillum sp. H4890]NKD75048.1 metalloregulator ArsR/SmtB family transcription factor [Haematospirillum sp. H4485]